MMEPETRVVLLQAKDGWNHQKEERGREQMLLRRLQRDVALLTLAFQTFSPQYCERIHFCGLF